MSLSAGARLGPYEILGLLGAGGMGEVYRARDTRLGREVAIKVLPSERLADPARRARFEREARAVAALNHPNIVTIHGIESADGTEFLVMELVTGQTLQTLIARRRLIVADVLKLAIPLADALATAHENGIVHRDVKPANVMVTPNSVVKVLDFGLAKLTQPDEASVGEATTRGAGVSSHPGVVMGTAGYMSPEQVAGEPADARSDVFSFGVVLYEMVTARRAFTGDSTAEVLAAVLRDEPRSPREIVSGLPKELERIVQRCLRKEPARRFQSMRDVELELREIADEATAAAGSPSARASSPPAGAATRARRWLPGAAAVAVSLAVLAAWCQLRRSPLGPALGVLVSARLSGGASFSPDGTQVAYCTLGDTGAGATLWLKLVGETETRPLTTVSNFECHPAWSPDGRQIAFVRTEPGALAGSVRLLSPLGGSERRLSPFPVWRSLSWSPDGRWLAASKAHDLRLPTSEPCGIYRLPADGGEPRALTSPVPPRWDTDPALAPDGRTLAYFSCVMAGNDVCDVQVLALDAEARPVGVPRRLPATAVRGSGIAWTRDARWILYGVFLQSLWRVRADGGAPPEKVELAGAGADLPFTARGQDRMGFRRLLADHDVYRYDVEGGTFSPFVASTATEMQPGYSPDGRHVVFDSARQGGSDPAVWLVEADGSNPVRLTRGPGRGQGSARFSPDGASLLFDAQAVDGHWDTWTMRLDGSALRQRTRRVSDHGPSSWSRDGRWIYFSSDRTGRREIWRLEVEGPREERVTTGGGYLPFESRDGRTLYYKRSEGDSPLCARPTAGGTERTIVACVPHWGYAVAVDGVFHTDCYDPSHPGIDLHHWDARTGRDRVLAALGATPLGLAASPDGRSVLFVRTTRSQDVMLIENFR